MSDTPQELTLAIKIRVLDEDLLRNFAALRMAQSGFESDPSLHMQEPLHKLAFEALIGSNPDPIGPDQMGLELVDWTDGRDGIAIPTAIKETLSEGLLASINEFDANDDAFSDNTDEDRREFKAKMKEAHDFLGVEMPE